MRNLIMVCLLIFSVSSFAKTAEQLRAAYLIQIPAFVRYTDTSHKPFKVTYCFAEQLGKVGGLIEAQQSVLKQRMNFSLVVVKQPKLEKLKECSYLYLAKNTDNISDFLKQADTKTIAIGEEVSVMESGALMALVQEQNKIRIHINRSKLDENTVNFNARLLSLAKVDNY
ncbi:YfiR family protein [Pseudoalteromonas sp.]|uniref:YfiR family protein n=1 Tax=Pseudoalteromonas sp. TaxID=53249 RepID=UPI0035632563